MQNLVNQRLREFMKSQNLNENSFSARCGLAVSTLNTALARDTTLKLPSILAIFDAFPFLSAEWLLRGEGSMFRQNQPAPIIGNHNNNSVLTNVGNTTTTNADALAAAIKEISAQRVLTEKTAEMLSYSLQQNSELSTQIIQLITTLHNDNKI